MTENMNKNNGFMNIVSLSKNVLQRLVTLKDLVRFESKIKHHASVVAEPNTQKKGTKILAETDAKMIKEASEDFGIEYSRTSRAKCRECAITITKGEIRIKKILYDTEVASRFGNQAAWYHYECFAKVIMPHISCERIVKERFFPLC